MAKTVDKNSNLSSTSLGDVRNFGLNTYPYHTGMSGEHSGKRNDKKGYKLN